MKNILFALSFFTLLFSCNTTTKDNKEISAERQKQIADSLRQDSIRIAELESIAFGDAKFGMTYEELRNTKTFGESKVSLNNEIQANYDESFIYGENYLIMGCLAKDTLYKVKISTPYVGANYIDGKLKFAANSLRKALEEKYGEFEVINSNPKLFEFKPGERLLMYACLFGDKKIYIYIYESPKGYEYKVLCEIESKTYREARNREFLESRSNVSYRNPL